MSAIPDEAPLKDVAFHRRHKVRILNCLHNDGVLTVGQARRKQDYELLALANFGVTSLLALRDKIGPVQGPERCLCVPSQPRVADHVNIEERLQKLEEWVRFTDPMLHKLFELELSRQDAQWEDPTPGASKRDIVR